MAEIHVTKKHNQCINNPFPSPPPSLPFVQGILLFNSQTLSFNKTYRIGNSFLAHWNARNGGHLSLSHVSQPERSLWSTVPGGAFVSAAVAETHVEESRGSFAISDRRVFLVCDGQTIDDIELIHDDEQQFKNVRSFPALVISGRLFSKKKKAGLPSSCARYWFLLDQKNRHQLCFQVRVGHANADRQQLKILTKEKSQCQRLKVMLRRRILRWKTWSKATTKETEEMEWEARKPVEFNRICITYSSEEKERFFGFGEQFSHMDFKGKRVPILVQEQGIGRGDQPITFAANCISYRSGGNWSTTYAPSPFYITSKLKSVYLDGHDYSVFDLTRHDRVHIQIHSNAVRGNILHGDSPAQLIENFTATIGRPPELPKWVISGAVVGIQGGTEAVRSTLEELKAYDVPVSAFWLQDWVGQRETKIGSQLWWNWEVDTSRYEGWRQLVDYLNLQQIKVMTYCNPCLAPTDEKLQRRRDHFEEARKLDILVKDKQGRIYMVPNTAFHVGMLDLTHPNAASWFKEILREMVDDGVRGWMADFGEGLPIDAVLYSGEDPITAHNRYPELWAKINREFVEEWKTNHLSIDESDTDELIFFMRAGFRDSPKWGMLFWEGDQMVSWQANDGIKSVVVGLLSGGISGYAFNHSDIGGYCTVNVPFVKYCRSEELLMRWMELNAFTTVFRTHEGNMPNLNIQFYSNERTLSHFSRCAKLYKAWYFYRIQLVKEAAQKGLPVCRHLFLHYPNDRRALKLTYQQFLVGAEMLVVPVLDKGRRKVKAYFPDDEPSAWIHIWTGNRYKKSGSKVWVDAPIGYPAVFVKAESVVGKTFLRNLNEMKIL